MTYIVLGGATLEPSYIIDVCGTCGSGSGAGLTFWNTGPQDTSSSTEIDWRSCWAWEGSISTTPCWSWIETGVPVRNSGVWGCKNVIQLVAQAIHSI